MQSRWLTGSPIHCIREYYAHEHNVLLRTGGDIETAPQSWVCAPGFALSLTTTKSNIDWTVDSTVIWNKEKIPEIFVRHCIPKGVYLGWLHVYNITATWQGDFKKIQEFFMYIHMADQLPPI